MPPTQTLLSYLRVGRGSSCKGTQPARAAKDLGFKYGPLGGENLAPLCYLWISSLPKTQTFSSSEQEKEPMRVAVICSVLRIEMLGLSDFFSLKKKCSF